MPHGRAVYRNVRKQSSRRRVSSLRNALSSLGQNDNIYVRLNHQIPCLILRVSQWLTHFEGPAYRGATF